MPEIHHSTEASTLETAVNSPHSTSHSMALLHMLHLSSPALPIGAYAYSQGLEYAIDSGWLKDEQDIASWLTGLLEYGLGQLDMPIILRCMHAWAEKDYATINHWNQFLRACRETSELLLEDEQLGMALSRLLRELKIPDDALNAIEQKPCFATVFALAGVHWKITSHDLLHSFAYSWLENQVAAATKIMPLGQTAAQKLLLQLLPTIAPIITQAQQVPDEALGVSLPGQVMASSLHEYQYSRLFRS